MTFDDRDVRRGMDVFTLDGVYLGWVLLIRALRQARVSDARLDPAEPSGAQGGEALGPMPTARLGNRGPATQAAHRGYAARPDRRSASLGPGELLVVRTPIGLDFRHLLPRLRRIPLDQIQTVSLERITLRATKDQF